MQSWKSRVAGAVAVTLIRTTSTTASLTLLISAALTDASSPTAPVIIDPSLEYITASGITVYRKLENATKIATVAEEFPTIWTDYGQTVDILEEEWMPILLKEGANPKPFRVYPLGEKDQEVVDKTFGKLYEHGKMEWVSQPTKFSYPMFVVWRDTLNG